MFGGGGGGRGKLKLRNHVRGRDGVEKCQMKRNVRPRVMGVGGGAVGKKQFCRKRVESKGGGFRCEVSKMPW